MATARLYVVLKEFSEVRDGADARVYLPGEVVLDPRWYAPNDRRGEARMARGQVELQDVEVLDAPGDGEVSNG
jgi:hypothetical protein